MQTFLPYRSFYDSGKSLDRFRLGKQRVEAMQILQILYGQSGGWSNHPAVLMWKGYEDALTLYTMCICKAWTERNYRDNVFEKVKMIYKSANGFDVHHKPISPSHNIKFPIWLDKEQMFAGYRSNLLRKNYDFYKQYGWTEPLDLPYYWPTKHESSNE